MLGGALPVEHAAQPDERVDAGEETTIAGWRRIIDEVIHRDDRGGARIESFHDRHAIFFRAETAGD